MRNVKSWQEGRPRGGQLPVEEADSVVAPVRHHNEPRWCAADAPGPTELTVARPLIAEL